MTRPVWPHTTIGVTALLFGVFALSLWFVFPMVTMNYRDIYPITDSWVMPAISSVITMIAAIMHAYAVLLRGERAWICLVLMIILGVISLLAVMVIAGGLLFVPSA